MRRKQLLKVALIVLAVFTIVGGYFWYLYFNNNEGKMISDNVRLQLLNNGSTDYINAIPNDNENNIPTYYFRVKNNLDTPANYTLIFNELTPSDVNDGCDASNYLRKSELMYELSFDNKIIKSGRLSELDNNILDNNNVLGKATNDYALRIFIASDTSDTLNNHYHYNIILKDENEKNS